MKHVFPTALLMRNLLWILISVFSLAFAHGQNNSNKTCLASIGKKKVYVELGEKSGTVFKLGDRIGGHLLGYSLNFTDTLIRRADTSCVYYSGKKTILYNKRNKLFLMINNDQKIKMDTVKNMKEMYIDINSAYWWSSFESMRSDISKKFIWSDYSFTMGLHMWELLDNKDSNYKDFISFADEEIKKTKDSIVIIETACTQLTQKIMDNILTIDYPELKENLLRLPLNYKSKYFRVVINGICINRPQDFFNLAEDLPHIKEQMFISVNNDNETIKKLKDVKTHLIVKDEFFKRK